MRAFLASILMVGAAACAAPEEDDLPTPDELECPTEGRYFPIGAGHAWTYRVDDGEIGQKIQRVDALEEMDGEKAGTMAYKMTTTKPSGGETISWQEDTGDAVLRHRELDRAGASHSEATYVPYRTRIDESAAHTAVGATWSETYTRITVDDAGVTEESERVDTWTVTAVDEVVRVPAGDFCALRVDRATSVADEDGAQKTYWFARGVGKVKEVGLGQTEELVDYTVE